MPMIWDSLSPTDADVNAANDGGYYARWGEPAPQSRGEHAGIHLG